MQISQELRNELANSGKDNNTVPVLPPDAIVYIYGHGPAKNPFYEEARALNATAQGASLVLSASVGQGQKVLVIHNGGQDPVEAHVVRTRTLDAQMSEVEIAFAAPQPHFWRTVPASKSGKSGPEKRRSPRIMLPRGMSIAWQGTSGRDVSRVSSLSMGGLFIESAEPAPAGDTLRLQFDVPGGAVRGQAVVRRSIRGKGMAVEFTELAENSRAALNALLQKLLGSRVS